MIKNKFIKKKWLLGMMASIVFSMAVPSIESLAYAWTDYSWRDRGVSGSVVSRNGQTAYQYNFSLEKRTTLEQQSVRFVLTDSRSIRSERSAKATEKKYSVDDRDYDWWG